jgi:hypothetical protein
LFRRPGGLADNGGVRSGGHNRRGWSLVGVGLVSVGALAALVAMAWFLGVQDPDRSGQWAGILGVMLAWLTAVTPAVVWVMRRARRVEQPPDEAVLARLRLAVQRAWTQEIAARHLYLPRPLRVRWRPTTRPGVQAAALGGGRGGRVGPGALLGEDGTGPAAVSLVEVFNEAAVRQLVLLGEAGAGKSTLAILYVVAAVTAAAADDAVPVPLAAAGWDPNTRES